MLSVLLNALPLGGVVPVTDAGNTSDCWCQLSRRLTRNTGWAPKGRAGLENRNREAAQTGSLVSDWACLGQGAQYPG